MFVGLSQMRSSEIRNPIPLSKEYDETYAGIWIVDVKTKEEVGHIMFEGDVDQIYDIALIPQSSMPELLNVNSVLTRHIFDFSEERI